MGSQRVGHDSSDLACTHTRTFSLCVCNQFYNKYITGLKTGHTSVAGRCVCVSYDDGKNSYIILVFNVKNEYGDSDSDMYYRNKNVDILLDYFLKLA